MCSIYLHSLYLVFRKQYLTVQDKPQSSHFEHPMQLFVKWWKTELHSYSYISAYISSLLIVCLSVRSRTTLLSLPKANFSAFALLVVSRMVKSTSFNVYSVFDTVLQGQPVLALLGLTDC